MGYDINQLNSNIRVSLGAMNKKSEIDRLLKLIQIVLKNLMNNNYVLPKDLNEALKNLENSIISRLKMSNNRYVIEFNFEGLKFNKIGITIYKILANYFNNKKINKNVFITYSDPGAVALAQRDYSNIKENIFTFKDFNESNYIEDNDSILISILPQPYDFDSFEPMCDKLKGYIFIKS